MKKLSELTEQELRDLFNDNCDFNDYCYEQAYQVAMDCQNDEFNNMNAKVFDYHNHYTSFYLSTPVIYGAKEPEAVAHKLDRDYMTAENMALYDKLNELTDEWENMDWDEQQSDKGEKLYDDMIATCDDLADGLTEQFREYENVKENDAWGWLQQAIEWGEIADWQTDGKKVYQTITKVYA